MLVIKLTFSVCAFLQPYSDCVFDRAMKRFIVVARRRLLSTSSKLLSQFIRPLIIPEQLRGGTRQALATAATVVAAIRKPRLSRNVESSRVLALLLYIFQKIRERNL